MRINERRSFLQKLFSFAGLAFLGCKIKNENNERKSAIYTRSKSKVVICSDNKLRDSNNEIIEERLNILIDKVFNSYFDNQTKEILGAKINKNTRVSIKVNCLAGKGLSTEKKLAYFIAEKLINEFGLEKNSIIIWDRLSDDLERAGYEINTGKGIKCFGNDYVGYTDDVYFFGEAGSLLSKIVTEYSDVIINIPVLKDHGIVGLSGCLKNMFGAIHNPNKYHINVGDPYVADVYSISEIKSKVILHVCDATKLQYEGGPPFIPKYCENFNSIIISEDPVAIDYYLLKLIEEKRRVNSLKSLKEVGRYPHYIFTAADSDHNLGFASDDKINFVKVDL